MGYTTITAGSEVLASDTGIGSCSWVSYSFSVGYYADDEEGWANIKASGISGLISLLLLPTNLRQKAFIEHTDQYGI